MYYYYVVLWLMRTVLSVLYLLLTIETSIATIYCVDLLLIEE